MPFWHGDRTGVMGFGGRAGRDSLGCPEPCQAHAILCLPRAVLHQPHTRTTPGPCQPHTRTMPSLLHRTPCHPNPAEPLGTCHPCHLVGKARRQAGTPAGRALGGLQAVSPPAHGGVSPGSICSSKQLGCSGFNRGFIAKRVLEPRAAARLGLLPIPRTAPGRGTPSRWARRPPAPGVGRDAALGEAASAVPVLTAPRAKA